MKSIQYSHIKESRLKCPDSLPRLTLYILVFLFLILIFITSNPNPKEYSLFHSVKTTVKGYISDYYVLPAMFCFKFQLCGSYMRKKQYDKHRIELRSQFLKGCVFCERTNIKRIVYIVSLFYFPPLSSFCFLSFCNFFSRNRLHHFFQ